MSQKYIKGAKIVSGKTKDIYVAVDSESGRPVENLVIVKNRTDITANDDASRTKQLEGKGKFATNTTCNIFELLQKAGIPVSYKQRIDDESFLVEKTEMIPLEVIIRRYAVGSYTKRMPHLANDIGNPHRFDNLLFEVFLKTTDNKCIRDDEVLLENISVEDPFIKDPYDDLWQLCEPKKPTYNKTASLGISIDALRVLQKDIAMYEIEELTRKAFLVIESAWAINYGYRLVDFKIEFGLTSDGELVISDVIDNDSWRLRTNDWKELSKENFRQGKSMDEISKTYELVSLLSDRLPIIPKQAIIVWRGSDKDDSLEFSKEIINNSDIDICNVIISAHKQPGKVLKKLSELEAQYPQGAVIIAIAGMSNGLGPILSAQTLWSVINCPPDIKNSPNDIWSSINLPSNVPASTIISPKNAVLHALNILSLSNPIAAMLRRYEIEEIVNS